MNSRLNSEELSKLIPPAYENLVLGLSPLHQQVSLNRLQVDFIRKMREAQVWPNEGALLKMLTHHERQAHLLSKLLESDKTEINTYFASLSVPTLCTMVLPILNVNKKDRSLFNQFKTAFFSEEISFEHPLEPDHFAALANSVSYEERLKLVKAQLSAFTEPKPTDSTGGQSFDAVQFINNLSLLHTLLEQRSLLENTVKGRWWERWWLFIKRFFTSQKPITLKVEDILSNIEKARQRLVDATLTMIQHYPNSAFIDCLESTLNWQNCDRESFFKLALNRYMPSYEDIQEHHKIRKTLAHLAQLTHYSTFDQELFVQHLLLQKNRDKNPYAEYASALTIKGDPDGFEECIINAQDQNIIEWKTPSCESFPIAKSVAGDEQKIITYLSLLRPLGLKVKFSLLGAAFSNRCLELIAQKNLYECLEIHEPSHAAAELVRTIACTPMLMKNDEFGAFYKELPEELKLIYLDKILDNIKNQSSTTLEEQAEFLSEMTKDNLVEWEPLIEHTSLSLQTIQYLLDKAVVDFKNDVEEVKLISILIKKLLPLLPCSSCKEGFLFYCSALLESYYDARGLMMNPGSLLNDYYACFANADNPALRTFLLTQIKRELQFKRKAQHTGIDRLFEAMGQLSYAHPMHPNYISALIGVLFSQDKLLQDNVKIWLFDHFIKTACNEPDLFLQHIQLIENLRTVFFQRQDHLFNNIDHMVECAHAARLISTLRKERDFFNTQHEWTVLNTRNWPSNIKKELLDFLSNHLKQHNLAQSGLGRLLEKCIHSDDAILHLSNLVLNPNEYVKTSVMNGDLLNFIDFLIALQPSSQDHLLGQFNQLTIDTLEEALIKAFQEKTLSMHKFAQTLQIMKSHLSKEKVDKVLQRLESLTQEKEPTLGLDSLVDLSCYIDHHHNRWFHRRRPLMQNTLIRIEYECLRLFHKRAADLKINADTLLEEVGCMIGHEIEHNKISSTLELNLNDTIRCKKLCELAILCVLLRHLNNKGSSEHIITGLQFLSAMSLSKKVADKARAVIEELDEESLNENADSKKSRFFKVGKVGQIFSGIKWG